jgi:peroxiredoxin
VPLLSDWNAEATLGFDVAFDLFGMKDLAIRSVFLIEGDTVRASWKLAREMPDVDAVIAAASSLSR